MSLKKITNKSYAFTLLELFLVLLLIGLTAGGLALSFPQLIKQERFEGAADALISKIECAQEMLFTYRCDTTLYLRQGPSGVVTCYIEPSAEVPSQLLKTLNLKTDFSEIDAISFNGKEKEMIRLNFYASGLTSPKGVVTLRSVSGKEKHIQLLGYPTKIERLEVFDSALPSPEIKRPFPREILMEGGQ